MKPVPIPPPLPTHEVATATFTMSLKRAIEFSGGTVTIDESDGISRLTNGAVGLQYLRTPWDPAYAPILTGKIVDHYWNREIGHESISLFAQAMRTKLNEIMPYYNQLYETTKLTLDPFSTMDIHTVVSGQSDSNDSRTGTNTSDTDATSASRSVASDTPQTMLSGDEDYASSASDVNSSSTSNGTATENSSGTNHVDSSGDTRTSGYNGVQSELLMKYRETLLNIDLAVIRDLEELFMGVFDNGDSYAPNSAGWWNLGYYPFY